MKAPNSNDIPSTTLTNFIIFNSFAFSAPLKKFFSPGVGRSKLK